MYILLSSSTKNLMHVDVDRLYAYGFIGILYMNYLLYLRYTYSEYCQYQYQFIYSSIWTVLVFSISVRSFSLIMK